MLPQFSNIFVSTLRSFCGSRSHIVFAANYKKLMSFECFYIIISTSFFSFFGLQTFPDLLSSSVPFQALNDFLLPDISGIFNSSTGGRDSYTATQLYSLLALDSSMSLGFFIIVGIGAYQSILFYGTSITVSSQKSSSSNRLFTYKVFPTSQLAFGFT